jgi:acetylornithine deacetylase/succinyl-diaminopimelate desuccinylase-like protein
LSLGHKTEDVTISEPEYGVLDREKIAKLQITHRLRTLNEPVLLLHRYRETARFICKSHGVRVRSAGIPRRSVKGKDGVEVKIRQLSLPWMTDPMNPFFEEARLALRTANCTVRGGIWSLNRLGRGTAGNILLDTYSIPTIGYGPGKTMTAHEQDECVEVSSIKEAFFGTSVIAHRLLGVSSPGVINKENKNHQ